MAPKHVGSPLGKFFGSLQVARNQPGPSAVGNLFASVAGQRLKRASGPAEGSESAACSKPSEEPVGQNLTLFLVKECQAKQELERGVEVKKKAKRRYNNQKRKVNAGSRKTCRGGVTRSRQDDKRVRTLLEQPSCKCSLGTCFSQLVPVMGTLMPLLILWSEQEKVVRDEVLRLCLRSTTTILGLKMSIACFRVLFKVGKRGVPGVDLRLKGQPRLNRSPLQEARARQYLISVYCRLGCSDANVLSDNVFVWVSVCFLNLEFISITEVSL